MAIQGRPLVWRKTREILFTLMDKKCCYRNPMLDNWTRTLHHQPNSSTAGTPGSTENAVGSICLRNFCFCDDPFSFQCFPSLSLLYYDLQSVQLLNTYVYLDILLNRKKTSDLVTKHADRERTHRYSRHQKLITFLKLV